MGTRISKSYVATISVHFGYTLEDQEAALAVECHDAATHCPVMLIRCQHLACAITEVDDHTAMHVALYTSEKESPNG